MISWSGKDFWSGKELLDYLDRRNDSLFTYTEKYEYPVEVDSSNLHIPYNLIHRQNGLTLEVDLCGVDKEDINLYQENTFLFVEVKDKLVDEKVRYTRKRIRRPNKLKFTVGDYEVKEVSYKNGLLTVELGEQTKNRKSIEIK